MVPIFAQTALLQRAAVTSDVGMCAEPASAPSTDVPSTGPSLLASESPSGPSATPSGSRPLDRPVFKCCPVGWTFVGSESGCGGRNRRRFHPHSGACSLFHEGTNHRCFAHGRDGTGKAELEGKDSIKVKARPNSTEISWIATSYNGRKVWQL
jgi:hypothetical protein